MHVVLFVVFNFLHQLYYFNLSCFVLFFNTMLSKPFSGERFFNQSSTAVSTNHVPYEYPTKFSFYKVTSTLLFG